MGGIDLQLGVYILDGWFELHYLYLQYHNFLIYIFLCFLLFLN